ncbi:MAG: DNA-processing protein DprA [Myxococcales bacterium]
MKKKTGQKAASRPRASRVSQAAQVAEPVADGPFTAEERATIAFFSVEGIGPKTLKKIRDAFGSLAQALREPGEKIAPYLNNDQVRQAFLTAGDHAALADRVLARSDELGIRVLFPGRPGWPRQFEESAGFPPLLYVKGEFDPDALRVAIVGSRDTDLYGEQLSGFFASALSDRGISIVSGGARGIDRAAHAESMNEAGGTIAVLGCGVDVVYPRENELLFQQLERKGALVSHFPPGTPAVAQNFLVRNRVIAALADVTLVVRADADSGSLSTAMAAIELRRPVFAIPGDVTHPLAAGSNGLLENALARACTGLAPIAGALGIEGEDWPTLAMPGRERKEYKVRSNAPPPRLAPPQRRAEVPEELRPIWEALGKRPVQFDELVESTGLEAATLANALVRLELLGLCEERAGKVFART